MKILHINTATSGGAAIAAIRLHKGMLNDGVDSHFLSLKSSLKHIPNHHVYDGPIQNLIPNYPSLSLKNWISERFFYSYRKQKEKYDKSLELRLRYITPKKINGVDNFGLFSYPDSIYDITQTQIYQEADVIHLHWVAGFLDYPSFFEKNTKPVFWTLHDANPYLGGFHHKDDEERNILTYKLIDEDIKNIKYQAIKKCKDLTVISPSFWLAEDARNSKVFQNRKVIIIRNGIDLSVFQPRDKTFSRQLLNIEEDKKVYLLASSDLSDYRKGIDLVLPVIESKEFNDVLFLLVGNNFNNEKYSNVKALGNISDELLMSTIYSAVDAFILPSRLDNLPNTMLESIACGTPIIGFNIGDNEEVIGKNNCGIICDELSTESLFSAVKSVLNNEFKFDPDLISEVAKELFSEKKIVGQYMEVYENLL